MKVTERTGIIKVLLSVALLFSCSAVMAQTDMDPVKWNSSGTETDGKSFLTRTDTMIVLTLEATGLVPGDAHTLWWVVFNNPGECATFPCSPADLGNPDVSAAIGNASGNVAKSDGTIEFGGRLVRGGDDAATGHQVLFSSGGSGSLLTASSGDDDAEVHLVIQTHGQARGGKKLREQLSMVGVNCTPSCEDVQFAIHVP